MKIEVAYNTSFDHLRHPIQFGSIRVFQIGRIFCLPTTVIHTHCQMDLFELTLVTGGSGIITTNSVPKVVFPGDIYLSFPGDFHKIESDRENPLHMDFFAFDSTEPEIESRLEQLVETHYNPQMRIFQDERIHFLIRNAIAEFNSDKFGKEALITNIVEQVPIYLLRNQEKGGRLADSISPKDAQAFCYRIMNYIDSHIYTIKGLQDISDMAGYSIGYLSALFRKTTSRSLHKYLDERRAEAARLLVAEGVLTVSQIAEKLNYSSVYAFSKAFTNWFGVSPRTYAHGHEQRLMQKKHEMAIEASKNEVSNSEASIAFCQ